MLCDLMIKIPPNTHFWKCYCAAHRLDWGHVQKLHTSNKDLLFEQLLLSKQPDIFLLLMGSSFFSSHFSPEAVWLPKIWFYANGIEVPFLHLANFEVIPYGKRRNTLQHAEETSYLAGKAGTRSQCWGPFAEQASVPARWGPGRSVTGQRD